MANKQSPYLWDPQELRYRYRDGGGLVSHAQVELALDEALATHQAAARSLSLNLRDRTVSLKEWQAGMRDVIRDVQLLGVATAKGGLGQLTDEDQKFAAELIRQQIDYLLRFARQIKSGKQRLDGRLIDRAGMYASAGRIAYWRTQAEMQFQAAGQAGYDLAEHNVLGPAEHCDECLEQTALGWVPIGTLIPVGERRCLSKCKCGIRYRHRGKQ